MFITTVITNFMQIDHILILNSEREGVGGDVYYGCGVGEEGPQGRCLLFLLSHTCHKVN